MKARILGIDPGTVRTGVGIIDVDGVRLTLVHACVVKASEKHALEARLARVFDGLEALIVEHRPDAIAVEEVFHGKFAQAALRLGHVRGVALLAAARAGITVHAYPPALIKRVVAGRGQADKGQVARIVGAMLGVRDLPEVDATDALAVSIAHARSLPMIAALTRA